VREAPKAKAQPEKKPKLHGKARVKQILDEYKIILIAVGLVVIVILAMFFYSGLWPPLVVVESGSMQHSDTVSSIGVIDTGDLVIVKQLDNDSVRTYVESYSSGYSTYSSYGDVIVYKRYNSATLPWIIHRAVLELVWNSTSHSFNIPDLKDYPQDLWSCNNATDGKWWSLTGTLELYHYGYKDQTVRIYLDPMLVYAHGGFVTKGDHNDVVDQYPMASICKEPIKTEWVVGLGRGEIPWFGLLKLWASGQAAPYDHSKSSVAPDNSWSNLFITIGLIIVIPVILDVADSRMKKRGIDMWGTIGKALDPRNWRKKSH
jgi:signal peptidase